MGQRVVGIHFPKGLLDTDARIDIANRLKREASVDLVDWKELLPNAKLQIDTKDLDIEERVIRRTVDLVVALSYDDGPACTWEE